MLKLLLFLMLTPSVLLANSYGNAAKETGHVTKVIEIKKKVLALEKADDPCNYDYSKVVELRKQISKESTPVLDWFTSSGLELRKSKERLEGLVQRCLGK